MTEQTLIALVFWFPAFLFSTTVHEAAHAWAALRLGDPTAYLGGQVSLNPARHIRREPVGMLLLPILTALTQGWTMGWASAPYDPAWAHRHPRRAAWMAAAGPAGNLVLALVALLALKAGLAAGWFDTPMSVSSNLLVAPSGGAGPWSAAGIVGRALSVLLVLNVMLAVFNLLPVPPLDGASVLGLVLPENLARLVRSGGPMFALVGLLAAWQLFPMLTRPLFRVLLLLLHPEARYG
jgi:Zn-dependent protease